MCGLLSRVSRRRAHQQLVNGQVGPQVREVGVELGGRVKLKLRVWQVHRRHLAARLHAAHLAPEIALILLSLLLLLMSLAVGAAVLALGGRQPAGNYDFRAYEGGRELVLCHPACVHLKPKIVTLIKI